MIDRDTYRVVGWHSNEKCETIYSDSMC